MPWILTILTLVLWPTYSSAQTPCAETADPQACLVVKTAEAMCRGAMKAEERLGNADTPGTCLGDLKLAETGKAEKNGQLMSCQSANALLVAQREDAPKRILPRWLEATWTLTAVALGAATGGCAGVRCPTEVTVGLAVGGGIVALSKLVWELAF